MTLSEACDHLRDLVRHGQDMVHFPRIATSVHGCGYRPGDENKLSDLESKLVENGIIRYARQEHVKRTYYVDYKRLNAVESEDGA